MTKDKFKQTIRDAARDAAAHTNAAAKASRFELTKDKLLIIQVRLTAAREAIDRALAELDANPDDVTIELEKLESQGRAIRELYQYYNNTIIMKTTTKQLRFQHGPDTERDLPIQEAPPSIQEPSSYTPPGKHAAYETALRTAATLSERKLYQHDQAIPIITNQIQLLHLNLTSTHIYQVAVKALHIERGERRKNAKEINQS